jgi:ferredoxin-thioredoxin reductase catalytic chain
MLNDKIEKLIREYKKYAKENGLRLNPDKKALGIVIRGLLANEEKYGIRYCPCRKISGNPKDDKNKVCPCAFHRQEIKEKGRCLCGLFVK